MAVLGACRISLVFFCCGLIQFCKAKGSSFGLCEAGDVISSTKGSVVLSKGSDCTRVILAPQGWRIKFTLFEIRMRDAAFYIHDGGTRIATRKYEYGIGELIGGSGTQVFFTSSNALLLHTDRISSNENILNATFESFAQPADRCVCPPTVNGLTVCTMPEDDSGVFYAEQDELPRECKTTCQQGYQVIEGAAVSASSIEMVCLLEKNKNSTTWAAKNKLSDAFDPNLVTCNKVTPSTQVASVYTFTYVDIFCADLNVSLIEDKVRAFLVRNASSSYIGECYKSSTENCTVQPITISCSTPNNPNNSLVRMEVRDNVKLTRNFTMMRMQYNLLVNLFMTTMKDQIKKYVTNYLDVNGTTAIGFQVGVLVFSSCPADLTSAGPLLEYPKKSCIPCPLHYYKHYYSSKHNFIEFSYCQKCLPKEQRQLNESKCVNGSKKYPKLSHSNCLHTCALGKFFNNNSGICEWCDYGQFQNSTTDLNPVCQRCPAGNTTAFVGAKKQTDCMKMCEKGQFVQHQSCISCAIGFYMPYEGNRFQKCYQCPSGKTTLKVGTVNLTDCVDRCSQGQYFNITQGMCLLCPNNTFQDEVQASNTRSCKTCPANSVTRSTGSTSSSACLGPCAGGEYFDVNTRRCEQCPLNTYNEQTSLMCKPCPKHKITLKKGSLNVSQCIYACTSGEFFNITNEKCEKCANNKFQDDIGQGSCKSCTGNTFTLKTGSKTCISPCHFGKFLNKSAEICQDCPIGYFQNNTNYVSAMCTPCPMDFYAETSGSQNCTACPNNGVTVRKAVTDVSECIERCSPGFYLNKTARVCQKCLKGFYQDQKNYRYETCTKCRSANFTTLAPGASSAEQCVGFCASSPCLNGAKCINIYNDFNCSCPQHLAGKQCQIIVDSSSLDKMEISVRFPNLVWSSNLGNPDSEEFMDLATQIENSVRKEFKSDATFRTVQVKNFKQGSVISDLEFNYVAGTDFGNPLDTLKTAVANGTIGNLTVDPSSLKIVNYTCSAPLGMEDGRIPDDALSSSSKDSYHPLTNARLNHKGPGWTPQVGIIPIDDVYLQVDFGEEVQLTGIATQGSSYGGGNWLEAYHITYSVDGKTWVDYKEDTNHFKVFGANTDQNTVERNDLKYPVRTRYVRIFRQSSTRTLSFRCEFYGCPIPKGGVLPTLVPTRTGAPTQRSTSSTESTTNGDRGTVSKSDEKDDSNTGLIVGLILGILALFVLIGVVVWYVNKKKRSRSFGGISAIPMKQTT